MRTDERTTKGTKKHEYVDLSQVSAEHQQKVQNKEQQEQKTTGVAPAPVVGAITGTAGTVGSIAAWVADVHPVFVLLIAILGCIGALISRGTNGDYDSISAKICIYSALACIITGLVILTSILKNIGFLDFLF